MSPRSLIISLLVICIGWICLAQDHWMLEATALTHLGQGSTSLACWLQPDRAGVSTQLRITPRIAVDATVGSVTPLAMAVQAHFLQQQPILHLALRAGTAGLDLLGTLDFGPVILEVGRHWIGERTRWARVELSPHPQLTLMIGLTETLGTLESLVGFRLSPNGHQAWSVLCGLHGDHPTLLVRGVLP